MEDAGYAIKGPKGQTCAECAYYKPNTLNPRKGACFGREVLMEGGCKFFKRKKPTEVKNA